MTTLYISFILFAAEDPEQKQHIETLKLDKAVSEWIQAVSTPFDVSKREEVADSGWWITKPPIVNALNQAMKSGVDHTELQRQIRRIVECTRTSPESAFRVYLHCYRYFQPNTNLFFSTAGLPLNEMFAKAQVEMWCKHPEEVERMVWFEVWLNGPDKKRVAMTLGMHISRLEPDAIVPEDTYETDGGTAVVQRAGAGIWSRRRLFMFLACITGSSQSYVGKAPMTVLEGYAGWSARLAVAAKNGQISASGFSPSFKLRASVKKQERPRGDVIALHFVPSTPFPDWGGIPVPVTPKWFRGHY